MDSKKIQIIGSHRVNTRIELVNRKLTVNTDRKNIRHFNFINPFRFISETNFENDILKFVEVLIKNTSSSEQSLVDNNWEKAEKLLYTAYIALMFIMYPEEERSFETLINMINYSEYCDDDDKFKNAMDIPDERQKQLGAFALKQYKAYKLAAGKTAKSILISCRKRLEPFILVTEELNKEQSR